MSHKCRAPKHRATSEAGPHCFLFLRLLKCFTSAGALPSQCRDCYRSLNPSPADVAEIAISTGGMESKDKYQHRHRDGFFGFTEKGFPIRTPPDQRLLATSPKFIAGTPRPSSLLKAKASTIRPYFHLPNSTHIFITHCIKTV